MTEAPRTKFEKILHELKIIRKFAVEADYRSRTADFAAVKLQGRVDKLEAHVQFLKDRLSQYEDPDDALLSRELGDAYDRGLSA